MIGFDYVSVAGMSQERCCLCLVAHSQMALTLSDSSLMMCSRGLLVSGGVCKVHSEVPFFPFVLVHILWGSPLKLFKYPVIIKL